MCVRPLSPNFCSWVHYRFDRALNWNKNEASSKHRFYAYVIRLAAAFVCTLLFLFGGVCFGAHSAVSERGASEKDESQRDYSHKDLLRSSNNLCIENGESGCIYEISVPRPHVIFVSIGFRGHAVPLLRIAEQFMKETQESKSVLRHIIVLANG